jgi:hypothetical protein
LDKLILSTRINQIRELSSDLKGRKEWFEAAGLAQVALYDTVGGSHPLMLALKSALEKSDSLRAVAASRGVVKLFDEGGLVSPRLAIAHEIEGDIINLAQSQVEAAERADDLARKQIHLAIAAFLAGAALEDALRRLCDVNGISYDLQRASIAKFQAVLFQPSKGIEKISSTENKQLTAWGDTRNKADHGKFREITHSEVLSMVIGARGLIDKHLP